jgi:hypothetical protein
MDFLAFVNYPMAQVAEFGTDGFRDIVFNEWVPMVGK